MWAARRRERSVKVTCRDFWLRTKLNRKLLHVSEMRKVYESFHFRYVDFKVPVRFLVGSCTNKSALKRTTLPKRNKRFEVV